MGGFIERRIGNCCICAGKVIGVRIAFGFLEFFIYDDLTTADCICPFLLPLRF